MVRLCSVAGCNVKHWAKSYCQRHYKQIKTSGHIRNDRGDDSIGTIKVDWAEIHLTNGGRALVDIEDVDKVKCYRWYNAYGYAHSNLVGRMHRLIMQAPENYDVDHINRDRLDNRKCNLRVCTRRQNGANHKLGRMTCIRKTAGGRFQVRIGKNNRAKAYGTYITLEEATMVRDRIYKELHGDYAPMEIQ